MATTPNYTVNYDDERFQEVQTDKEQALTEIENTYGGMIDSTDKYYDDLINQSKENADKQAQIQQENTDFAIEKIEQQREQDKKDYTKEQSGAYVDWQKQSNQYGVKAEQMAMQGLVGSGYSESAQVSMYVAYQNRVASAREVMAKANQEANNNIQQAILQNNSALAEIYANANKEQLEIALQGFQYKNSLLEAQMNAKQEADDRYYNRYQDVLAQINQENALAEEVRQYNESLAMQQKQLQEEIRQFEQSYALQVKEYEEGIRQFNEEIARLKAKDKEEHEMEIKQLELQKQQLAEQKRQADLDYKVKQQQLAEEKRQYDSAYKVSTSSSSSSKSSKSGSSSGSSKTSKGQIQTQYYSGPIAENVGGFGYMGKDNNGNAYQPKGVYVNGKAVKLSKSGKTAGQMFGKGSTNSSGVNIDNQNVWKAGGQYFIWNGSKNKYERVG